MDGRLTGTLHELVLAMDGYADHVLTSLFGVDRNLLAFLTPLAGSTMDVTRLAALLNLTKAAVSKRAPALERQGWLTISADPAHGRRVLLSLTDSGERLVGDAGQLLNRRFAGLLDDNSIDAVRLEKELRTLIGAVRALAAKEES